MRKTMRLLFTAVGLSAACGFSIATFTTAADASAASKLKTYDTDHDGTLDLKEVTAGATTAFNALEKDHDGTLDLKELKSKSGQEVVRMLK